MDKLKNNKENAVIASIEYPYSPTATADTDEVESNKSTPYYTPLEYLQTSFEFPSPTAETPQPLPLPAVEQAAPTDEPNEDTEGGVYTPKQFTIATPKQPQSQSPTLNRKFKRFSLYDRRSCSPHLTTRSASTAAASSTLSTGLSLDERETKTKIFANKENTIPRKQQQSGGVGDKEQDILYLSKSEHNSPTILFKDDSSATPNSEASRLSYSPKLLSSINNLNLSGSPLNIINSAGYKNGNFFRFPEIDHVVDQAPNAAAGEEQPSSYAGGQAAINVDQKPAEQQQKCEGRKNRKNKNNLTIRITDVPIKGGSQPPTGAQSQVSPLPKPKTPTIKSTKEKARSLDSAANEVELSIVVHNITESHGSCDDMEAAQLPSNTSQPMNQLMQPASSLHSTSLSRLDTSHAHSHSLASRRCGSNRRKSPGLNSSDWLMYHRKHNPYQVPHPAHSSVSATTQTSLDSEQGNQLDYNSDSPQRSAAELKSACSVDSSSKFGLGASLAPRSAHKHNQLLHASSTNLKTLPECLTLVEFSSGGVPSPKPASNCAASPFKQKSMDLPASNLTNLSTAKSAGSSMNLLQRRGSNHSLTLNLHSSCGNLMNSGLSVSNYSLGSILNSKSSCNLDLNAAAGATVAGGVATIQQPALHAQPSSSLTPSQVTRQGLFRRRGSNHSITLKGHTTTSCGDLNSMSNLGADKYRLSVRTNSTGGGVTMSNTTTPKRGLLERRGSNQSLTLNMGSSSQQQLANSMMIADAEQPKLLQTMVCSCAASQAPHQRKFYSTENLNTNRSGGQPYFDFDSKQQVSFGSAAELQPSGGGDPQASNNIQLASEEISCTCHCSGAGGGGGGVGGVGGVGVIRNIMTRPLSPQTTSEEFKIYLASIQMLQSATNPLNQFDLIKLNYVFDNSYKTNRSIIEQPPLMGGASGRDADTPTSQLPPTSEDSALLASYQAVVKQIVTPLPQLDENEQKRIFRELHKEFWDLPLNHQEKPMVFGSQTKNRYKTILPNEHSRVQLESETSELISLEQQTLIQSDEARKTLSVASEEMPYINANYIKGPDYVSKCYVATQGPMPNTIFEFWLMVYQNTQRYIRRCVDGGSSSSPHMDKAQILQQYFQKIVMLTNFTESSRQKCAIYFPIELNKIFAVAAKCEVFELSESARDYFEQHLMPSAMLPEHVMGLNEVELNSRHIAVESLRVTLSEAVASTLPAANNFFLIKNVGIVRRNGYSIRKLVLLYCISVPGQPLDYHLQKICCYHYWYPDWPDHHSPRDINTLLDTCLHVLNLGKCESEFDNYDEQRRLRNAHLLAQRLEIYKQDIFNAVQPLPVIHCSAGIGRTGCFTAILNAIRQLRQSLAYSLTGMLSKTLTTADLIAEEAQQAEEQPLEAADADIDSSFTCNTILHIRHIVAEPEEEERLRKPTFDKLPKMPDIFVDVLGIVCNLRLQRGGMVQNSEQYELIHRAICLYLKRTLALRRF